MKILVINGVNLNMVGIREPDVYGKKDFKALVEYIKETGKNLGLSVTHYQSNYEGDICTQIQKAYDRYDGIIINAGAYTHTSIAILDALKAVNIPTVEVHLSNVYEREEFRRKSYISLYAEKVIVGKGFDGYGEALKYFADKKYC
ncbi:MAG: type II 3-dehydroquinate dehydratase [Clostridia bacterium]|nr:type II 3-dehydroquinate dehydratase [Clostridia bacterium]